MRWLGVRPEEQTPRLVPAHRVNSHSHGRKSRAAGFQKILLTDARISIGASVEDANTCIFEMQFACGAHARNPKRPNARAGPAGCPARLQANQCERACQKGKWQGHVPLRSLPLPARLTCPPTRPLCCNPQGSGRHSVPVPPTSWTAALPCSRRHFIHPMSQLSSSSSRLTMGRQSVQRRGQARRDGSGHSLT